ncbi:3-octaprenyl-4-hydroxybenzoate carboxy-lyase [mine drainage metagenome]|uniref:3-octaprenyl-4-hydroxybenzoate carboxy-lyase n=1 Tax=mine drainage metagenome TaxID=410659 RepID=T1BH37_9ZZZZ
MSFDDLEDYISFLSKNNDLLEIEENVDPYLELTYILDREQYNGRNKTILFTNVKNSQIPVIGNIFSNERKMEWILGDKPYEVGMRMRNLIRPPEESDSMISRGLEMLRELSGLRPKIHGSIPSSMKVLDKVDLDRYPICTTWPKDGGPFITLPVVITKDPLTGTRNAGMYRLQKFDSETLGMHWQIHKGGSQHMQNAQDQKKIMDVAVTIGTDPLTIFSSVAPLPDPFDEFSFSGLISGKELIW